MPQGCSSADGGSDLLGALRFLRIHRTHPLNLDRIGKVRLQAVGRDWEIELDPPVNRMLPFTRGELDAVWRAVGEGE